MRGSEKRVLPGAAGEGGSEGREGADLGLLIGLQGQQVGFPESLGSLAEGPEESCLTEAGGRPEGSTRDEDKGTRSLEEEKDGLN